MNFFLAFSGGFWLCNCGIAYSIQGIGFPCGLRKGLLGRCSRWTAEWRKTKIQRVRKGNQVTKSEEVAGRRKRSKYLREK